MLKYKIGEIMAEKIKLIGNAGLRNDKIADELFDDAIRLCLRNGYKQKQLEIIKLFSEYFVTENNIPLVNLYYFKSFSNS